MINNGCITVSHWPWFKHVENIFENPLFAEKFAGGDEDKAIVTSTARDFPWQLKSLAI
ncbi:hypothetical protein AHAS_Ahas11G0216100 [Arachis hypogaea]